MTQTTLTPSQQTVNVLLDLKGKLFFADRDSDAAACDQAIALIVEASENGQI